MSVSLWELRGIRLGARIRSSRCLRGVGRSRVRLGRLVGSDGALTDIGRRIHIHFRRVVRRRRRTGSHALRGVGRRGRRGRNVRHDDRRGSRLGVGIRFRIAAVAAHHGQGQADRKEGNQEFIFSGFHRRSFLGTVELI